MYLFFHRLWTKAGLFLNTETDFLLVFLQVPVLPVHTRLGNSDIPSKGVSCNLGLFWEVLSAVSFDLLIHWDLMLFWIKIKEKKAWGELCFSANDRPILYPTPAAAVSGVQLHLLLWHNNFAWRMASFGQNWSPDWIGGNLIFRDFGWRWIPIQQVRLL